MTRSIETAAPGIGPLADEPKAVPQAVSAEDVARVLHGEYGRVTQHWVRMPDPERAKWIKQAERLIAMCSRPSSPVVPTEQAEGAVVALRERISRWRSRDYLGDDRLEVDEALSLADDIEAVIARTPGQLLHELRGRFFSGGGWADYPAWTDYDEAGHAIWEDMAKEVATAPVHQAATPASVSPGTEGGQ